MVQVISYRSNCCCINKDKTVILVSKLFFPKIRYFDKAKYLSDQPYINVFTVNSCSVY